MSRNAYALLSVLLTGIAGYLVATNYNVGSILTLVPQVAVFISIAAGLLGGLLGWLNQRWSLMMWAAALILVMALGVSGSDPIPWWATLLLIVSFVSAILRGLPTSVSKTAVGH